ncbi:MAG: GNAT family N-acetyltransferase [Thermoplasmata archaeon]|nr:GNAT family N-acetyltransferase [Thermoplasmata archaeon]NIS12769.1 GNAT family N-acetyltransferase [Thermoplasmata archaeon]NIS19704.1 GNAT family N-acetyltransferase [Thermoplasmata archaeon]NIT76887.1 GNAT family N-acetyltransferase [Thermoplasmata archaeon]NIU48815.1 GNAT family N-acetyltransferase [Thermoplasmata archaeon]
MTIYQASSVSMAELATVFNQAFSDYLIEVYFTRDSLREYVHRHGLDLDASLVVGADGLLVGLLLSGSDSGTTWNAGMGMHPNWRRRGLGSELLDEWLAISRQAGLERALLEVIKQNLVATNLYRSRGFKEVRAYQGFEGRPAWERRAPINPETFEQVDVEDLIPVYRRGHSWQKRPDVLRRLGSFEVLRTKNGEGYLIYENVGGLMYIFDMTPNDEGRALLEHATRREVPRLIRVVNAIDLVEEDLYRQLGFRPWIRNVEMVLRL